MADEENDNADHLAAVVLEPVQAVFDFDTNTHRPEKRTKLSVNWDTCICHGFSSNPDQLERFTEQSWAKLCNAAIRRKDLVPEKLQYYINGEKHLPKRVTDLFKHHNCYSSYTLEKSIARCENVKREPAIANVVNQPEVANATKQTLSARPSSNLK